jgi:nicotinate-nucleotide pyrophosphorylase (carboxylating)
VLYEEMDMDRKTLERLVAPFLAEDVGRGDITTDSVVADEALGRARIEARESAVVAGLPVARAVFDALGGDPLEWVAKAADGDRVEAGDVLVTLDGSLRTILTGERTALNLLGHLSGVATRADELVRAIDGTKARIVDTRKTTPGLRLLEKYAVRVGGGSNHRFGLDDAVLIKDNHIAAAGGVGVAVSRAKSSVPHTVKVEVEVEDLAGLDEAIAAGADSVLLDNMTVDEVGAAVARADGRVLLEVSGGIDVGNVRAYAETGVDVISVGAITHSARTIDVALEVEA